MTRRRYHKTKCDDCRAVLNHQEVVFNIDLCNDCTRTRILRSQTQQIDMAPRKLEPKPSFYADEDV